MRHRIRLALPLAQVAIAIALIVSNSLRKWGSRPPFQEPDLQFCCALNAPATVIWSLFLRLKGNWYWAPPVIGVIVERLALLVLVALLWYAVSVEISGSRQSVLTKKTKIRNAADVLLLAFAGYLAAFGYSIRNHEFGFVTTYSTLVATPYFIWSVLIAAFYGHDLWVSLRHRRE